MVTASTSPAHTLGHSYGYDTRAGVRNWARDPVVCWYQGCDEKHAPECCYCPVHEMLYRANNDGKSSIMSKSLNTLTTWEEQWARENP